MNADDLPHLTCPYCGGTIGAGYKDSQCTIPSGLWFCDTCCERSGISEMTVCNVDYREPHLKLVE